MTPEDLRTIMDFLRTKVVLGHQEAGKPLVITFPTPTEEEMLKAGLNDEGVKRILGVPWWGEMEEDIVETPDMCEPGDSPEQVLEYARDVISEYIRKRFPLQED